MNARYEDELRIAERAAEWHQVLSRTGQEGAGSEEHMQFIAWLEESPKHIREFLLTQAWEIETQGIDRGRQFDMESTIRKVAANVVSLPGAQARRSEGVENPRALSGKGRVRWAAGLAAAVMIAMSLLWWSYSERNYSTAIGEMRKVELADGSKMELGASSRAHVSFSEKLREIELLHGEASFKVQTDASRPFRVHAGSSVIQAVGTEFTVNRRPLGTLVAVREGSVRVYAGKDVNTVLAAGEQVRLGARGELEKREHIEDAGSIARQRSRLVFRDDALADIAAEFNRHNRSVQLVIEDDTARHKRYGGIFDADDPEAIVRFIERDEDLSIERKRDRIVIRAK